MFCHEHTLGYFEILPHPPGPVVRTGWPSERAEAVYACNILQVLMLQLLSAVHGLHGLDLVPYTHGFLGVILKLLHSKTCDIPHVERLQVCHVCQETGAEP